jgi:hypothetical protein
MQHFGEVSVAGQPIASDEAVLGDECFDFRDDLAIDIDATDRY